MGDPVLPSPPTDDELDALFRQGPEADRVGKAALRRTLAQLRDTHAQTPLTLDGVEATLETHMADRVPHVRSVAELRAQSPAFVPNKLWLDEYNAGTGRGGGLLILDRDDQTTTDNAGSVFVTAGGRRYRRPNPERFDVMEFGALGDGSGTTVAEWLVGGRYDQGYEDLEAIRADYPFIEDLAVTIDQAAHWSAFIAADRLRISVWTPPGKYEFHPLLDRFSPEADFVWLLADQARILRSARSQSSTWHRMIYITPRKSIDRVVIRGGHFDGNARENPPSWTSGERVEVDEFRRNTDARTGMDRVYRCTSPGTTALSGTGPQGKSAPIPDADVLWEYVADTRSWFGWEQSSLVMIAAAAGVAISTVLVEDVLIEDPTADGIRVIANHPGSVVELFAARNIRSIKRSRPRADIIWYQQVRHSLITDCHVQRIETEPTGPPLPAGQDNLIANCITDIFDIAGKGAENAGLFRFFVNNLVVKQASYLGSPRAHFSNCDLTMRPTDGRVFGNKTFINCHFRIQFDAAANAWVPIRPSYLPEVDTESRFTRCTFSGVSRDRGSYGSTPALRYALPAAEQGDYARNEETETIWAWDRTTESWVDLETSSFLPEGPAIRPITVVRVDEPWARRLLLDGCSFARDDFEHCLMIYRCGTLESTGNTYRSRGGAIATMTSSETRAEVRSTGDDFTAAAVDLVIGHVPESSVCRILIDGIHYGVKGFRTAGSTWVNARIASARIVMIESENELRGGLVGDVARLLPAAGEGWISGTFEWLCIKSHPTQAVWIPNRTIGGSGRE